MVESINTILFFWGEAKFNSALANYTPSGVITIKTLSRSRSLSRRIACAHILRIRTYESILDSI